MTRVKPHHILLGSLGESWVEIELKRQGYNVTRYGGVMGFDLLVNNCLTIDAKTATRAYDKSRSGYGWQFNLQRHHSEHVEHLTICLCVTRWTRKIITPGTVFLIPGKLTQGQQKITITSKDPQHYMGKYVAYRDSWGIVDELMVGLGMWTDELEEIPF